MLKLKRAVISLLAVSIFGISALADVIVKLDGIGNSDYMIFNGVQPVMHDDTLFVPARAFADSTGMDIQWDQSTETALLSVNIEDGVNTSLEKYFNEIINKISGYGLEITPKSVSAALTAGKYDAVLRFIFKDTDGDELAIGKTVSLSYAPEVINDSTFMLPLRDTASVFSLTVGWSQEDLAVSLSIPEYAVVPVGMKIIPVHTPIEKTEQVVVEEVVSENAPVEENKGTYLGRFKITHYCPCSTCNGGWGNNTAYAGKINPGQTIAVDPKIIPPLSWVYIDGYGLRRAEDCGGSIKGNHIDMAVSSHSEAYRIGVVYKDVWLQN